MKDVIFISDYFSNEILGGAEFCNEALIEDYLKQDFNIIRVKSANITKNFIENNKNNFFIIANFFLLSEENKNYISENINYVIYEHDHKYLKNNNPAIFENFLSPEENIQNLNFFSKAKYVLCQSTLHAHIIYKNIGLKNIVNLKGNIWKKQHLEVLKNLINTKKEVNYGILNSQNKNKGMISAINYCNMNKINYNFIYQAEYSEYMKNLSKIKNFIFFPTWIETFSRLAIESRILGCNLITNNFLGCASDGYLKYTGNELLELVIENQNRIVNIFKNILNNLEVNTYTEILPKISIITSLFNAERYISSFLENITKQTIFKECELILINANSPENEYEVIKKYLDKFDNIKYFKLEEDPGIYECWNIGIKNSSGDFICNSNVDDLRLLNNLEILRKHLHYNNDIDLVYGDCIKVNEVPQLNKNYKLERYEHSINTFSKENMIKCLPGPLPLWRKNLHNKFGYFDSNLKFAGDWEMWNRLAYNNCKFKKINLISGFYYENPTGKSTNLKFFKNKFLEEKQIFFKYKELFGKNYDLYLNYFSQAL